MKHFLKYLILFLVAVTFFEAPAKSDITSIPTSISSTYLSEPEADICILRQSSGSHIVRPRHNAKKTDSLHKDAFVLIKSRKPTKHTNKYPSYTDNTINLIRIGRLLI